MPPERGTKTSIASASKRRSTRRKAAAEDEIPAVYQEMLDEAVAAGAASGPSRPNKRLKTSDEPPLEPVGAFVSQEDVLSINEPTADTTNGLDQAEGAKLEQIIYNDFSASSSDEDAEFEDVDLEIPDQQRSDGGALEHKSLQIDLSKHHFAPKQTPQRRKLATPAERALRLSIHKTHLLLLVLSIYNRNRWCEDAEIQAILKPLISKETINQLHLDESQPQWKRSHAFEESIKEVCSIWRNEFQTTVRGMRRAIWRSDIDMAREIDEAEDMLDFDDFKTAAQTRSGSRDLGAELFCALLRSLAVDARLVCSLQVLPFSAAATQETPQKPMTKSDYTYAPSQDFGSSASTLRRNKLNESPYPVFWVEALSPATSTWIPLDPLVRNTINKPKTGFEPPASDQLNAMSYVIAFEDNCSARDVTRRYTQWFNAKTRKTRVESTKGGEAWYASVTRFFEKRLKEDRDVIEDAELARRCEVEGMPKNVMDFKGHPLYVLERHLRRNEVIHPKKEAGKVAVGAGHKSAKLESVFRRKHVHVCRSVGAWYRRGRDIKSGETPLKRVVPKRREARAMSVDDEDPEDDAKALYAEFQTELYVPPPVNDGRIPRNAFGNLDVYVPNMIPAGAIHVRHPMAAKAAKVLGISYADAVTGFEFKGRRGTAVLDGAVVAADQRVAMVAVVVGLQSQASDEIEALRSRIVLAIWKKWLAALRVREQIQKDYGDRPRDEDEIMDADADDEDAAYHDEEESGGFIPDLDGAPVLSNEDAAPVLPALSLPGGKLLPDDLPPPPSYHEIVVIESPHKLPTQKANQVDLVNGSQDYDGSLFGDEQDDAGADVPVIEAVEDEGGGFLLEDEANAGTPSNQTPPSTLNVPGGGFMPDEGLDTSRDTGITIASCEIEHETHSPQPDVAGQAQRAAEATPASSTKMDTPPQHLPLVGESNTGPPESTQSSILNDVASDTSMLSHDPEEDEAEPEWLHDSLGF